MARNHAITGYLGLPYNLRLCRSCLGESFWQEISYREGELLHPCQPAGPSELTGRCPARGWWLEMGIHQPAGRGMGSAFPFLCPAALGSARIAPGRASACCLSDLDGAA